MVAQLDSFYNEFIDEEAEAFRRTMLNVTQHFGVDSEDYDPEGLKQISASTSEQNCHEALPILIDLLLQYVRRIIVQKEMLTFVRRTRLASKKRSTNRIVSWRVPNTAWGKDSNTIEKTVHDSLLDAHDKPLDKVNCLKIGRERYRAHIDDLKAKLNAAKQSSALGKKEKEQ